jgi:hypothetical protein
MSKVLALPNFADAALPANDFPTTVVSADVPTALLMADESVTEALPADTRALLPPVDLSECERSSPALRRRDVLKAALLDLLAIKEAITAAEQSE